MTKLLLAATAMAFLCLSFTKEKPFTPPGTVQINDTLFADETEITNIAWQEYEFWTASIYGKKLKRTFSYPTRYFSVEREELIQ